MERDLLLTALVREVLGPRGGARETLKLQEDPLEEYITGVLVPHGSQSIVPEADLFSQLAPTASLEDDADPADGVQPSGGAVVDHLVNPSLDPKSRASSLGISFSVSQANGKPVVDVCCTWARYRSRGDEGWTREPFGHLWPNLNVAADQTVKRSPPEDPGVLIQVRSQRERGHWRVSVFIVNASPSGDGKPATEDCVFQPQIRIRCGTGTELVPLDEGRALIDDEDRALAMLYRNRRSYARGHLCAAIWEELDPERPHASLPPMSEAPYCWADGMAIFDAKVQARFSPAHVRSEYVPIIPVGSPERLWDPTQPAPELRPDVLSETWEPAALRAALSPLGAGYSAWVAARELEVANLPIENQTAGREALAKARAALGRIQVGIDLLVNDTDARLAFCFANQAIATQSRWTKRRVNPWFPFQLAFQLLNVSAIVQPTHEDREICDLLWFPTGGGKTEAYLGLAAFTMAYRRLRSLREGNGLKGEGVAILSRYTLRLLTIQQFRRALALITACELLRVTRSEDGATGWRPKQCKEAKEGLWGSGRFSAGLWVGGGVTPNSLQSFTYKNQNDQIVHVAGAFDILHGIRPGEGEPAQVLNCPACGAILAVPPEGFHRGESHTMHIVLRDASFAGTPPDAGKLSDSSFHVTSCQVSIHTNKQYCTLTLHFTTSRDVKEQAIDHWCKSVVRLAMGTADTGIVAARGSRPGYFLRYADWGVSEKPIEFEIYCPDPKCALNSGLDWNETTASGPRPVHPAFEKASATSERCPIPAWTVDEQVYHRCPSMVVATVDKFARLSFEPRAAALFGNVEQCNEHLGYYRRGCAPQGPSTEPPAKFNELVGKGRIEKTTRFDPPDLILQDELHLIDGPLGSMVGIYETAVDLLSSLSHSGKVVRPKYIASTATVRQAREQVKSLFAREFAVFPPTGLVAEDSFFARVPSAHPRDSEGPGRLYLGICAPGLGVQRPLRNVWARMLQHMADRREAGASPAKLDPFWTLVGYFNAIRELAGTVALVRQDIPQRLNDLSAKPRTLAEEDRVELSSRIKSLDLPGMLDQLNISLTHTRPPVSVVVATSMFGTGVDVDRLGLMVVHGQPKTSSSYIQATGRVGRARGGLVVTLFRASRPRDLNHYEFFATYHSALYRHVEPVTVNPFSPRARDRALGPVSVAILRQGDTIFSQNGSIGIHPRWRVQQRLKKGKWHCLAGEMAHERKSLEVMALPIVMEERAQQQPESRRPDARGTKENAEKELNRWEDLAKQKLTALLYYEPNLVNTPQLPVVLGDRAHLVANTGQVYEQAPTSLREVESTTTFGGWLSSGDRPHQEIRPSQFVITYGPGTVLETRSGPVVIKSMDQMFKRIERDPQDFEIVDPRLSRELGGRIVRLPTNDELQIPVEEPIYPTERFPYWALCTLHNPQILYDASKGCPECPKLQPFKRLKNAGQEAIRFLMACPQGHLDEVDWHFVIHGGGSTCRPDSYRWHGGSRALRFVELECPECSVPRVNLANAFGRPWPCTGRHPEKGPLKSGCGNGAKMIQRGAANIRVTVSLAALTIPDLQGRLQDELMMPPIPSIASSLGSIGQLNEANFYLALANQTPAVPAATLTLLKGIPWDLLEKSLQEVNSGGVASSGKSLKEEEFERLERAATEGAPTSPSTQPGGPPLFEVPLNKVKHFNGPSGRLRLRVAPVSRLRMVFVQKAYERILRTEKSTPVSADFTRLNQRWYPGVELFGEGIFLDLDGAQLTLTGHRLDAWQRRFDRVDDSNGSAQKGPGKTAKKKGAKGPVATAQGADPAKDPSQSTESRLESHPVHVWWHTLSHRLLRALAVDSGYSSSAIRERVYVTHDNGKTRGGLLLYTVQPGGDGTLGGLISLVPRFDKVLEAALRDLGSCSNDPLCEQSPQLGAEGAACYSCVLTSETSCDQRNSGLDRLLLLENLP